MAAPAHPSSFRRFECRVGRHKHVERWCRDCKQHYRVCITCGDHP